MAVVQHLFENMEMTVGGKVIGCADTITVSSERDFVDVGCKASGGWDEKEPSTQRWSGSADGVYRTYTAPDATDNIGAVDFMALKIAGTKVALTWGPDGVGETSYQGEAYISNVELSSARGDKTSYSVEFLGTGPLLPVVNA